MTINYGDSVNAVTPISRHPSFQDAGAQSNAEVFQGLQPGLPPMPSELGQIAKNMWAFVGKQLVDLGMISAIDLSVFRRYCETYQHYVDCEREVREKGQTITTPKGFDVEAPWSYNRRNYSNELSKLENNLFLHPRARKAIKLENPQQSELNLD